MEETLVVLAAAAAFGYVALPMIRGIDARWRDPDRIEEAEARKVAALSAIVDLENERATGKLSDEDFEALNAAAEAEALAALAEADLVQSTDLDDDELEREIAEMRDRLVCPSCGSLRTAGERCARCDA